MNNYKITEEEINKLKYSSPFALPISPSERGMKPEQIKGAFWKPFQILVEIINKYLEIIEIANNNALEVANGIAGTANNALKTSQTAENTANAALAQVPKIYFESGFSSIVGATFIAGVKNGDIMFNTEANTPDFVVFAVGQFNTSNLEVLTYDMLINGTLPTPKVGDKYLIQDVQVSEAGEVTPTGNSPKFGIIAIESGGVTATINVDSDLSETSENPVQNKVITVSIRALDSAIGNVLQEIAALEENLATHKQEYEGKVNGIGLDIKYIYQEIIRLDEQDSTFTAALNSHGTELSRLGNELTTVESVAKGANQAVAFGSYEEMILTLNQIPDDIFNIGQNIYIKRLNVPDLWVSRIYDYSATYTYISDEDLIEALNNYGAVQVGYYAVSALETQKVDLTDYAKKEYVDNSIQQAILDSWEVAV